MQYKLPKYICALCLSVAVTSAYAQEEADTLAVSVDSVAQDSVAPASTPVREFMSEMADDTNALIDFDPYEYRVQNRYLPTGAKFRSDSVSWLRHMKYRIYTGAPFHITTPTMIGDLKHTNSDLGIQFGMGLNYNFSRLHGMRLDFQNITYRNMLAGRVNVAELELGYLFNLTNYFKGFDPKRRFTVSAGMGVGGSFAKVNGEKQNALRGELSLLFDYRFWRNFSLYVEPYFGVTTDNYDRYNTSHEYDIAAGVRGGLAVSAQAIHDMHVRVSSRRTNFYQPRYFFQHIYFGASGGPMYSTAPIINGLNKLWMSSHVFLGYTFTPNHSVRAMATYFKTPEGLERNHHVMGEVDYMVNVTNLRRGYYPDHRFHTSLFAGAGARYLDANNGGFIEHNRSYDDKVAPFVTLGMNFQYNVTPQISLFVEPYGGYAIPFSDGCEATLFGGVRGGFQVDFLNTHIYMPHYAFSKEDRKVVNDWKRNAISHVFLGTSSGVLYEHKEPKNNYRMTPLNVFFGYRFTPAQALRAKATYLKTESNLGARKNHIAAEIDYMVNFSNLFYGYKPKRRLNVIGYVGGGIKYLEPHNIFYDEKPEKEHLAMMLTAGTNIAVRLINGVSLFVEPHAGLHRAKPQHYYTFTYGVDGGIALNFEDCHYYSSLWGRPAADWTTNFWKRFYVMGGGGVMGVHTHVYPNMWTYPMNMSLGYRFTPNISVRGRGSYIKTNEELERDKHIEGQVDLVLNLSNLLFGYNPKRLLNVSGFAGFGARYLIDNGGDREGHFAPMANMGMDLAIRLKKGLSTYFEPYLAVAKHPSHSYYTMYYGANAGLALAWDDLYNYNPRLGTPSPQWSPKRSDRFFFGFMGGFLRTQYCTDRNTVPGTAFAGYRFSPNHGLRAKVMYNVNDEVLNHRAHVSAGVDYMINTTNLLAGYDKDRRFNIITFLGLGMRTRESDIPNDKTGKPRLYGNVGADIIYKLTRNVNLFVEPYVGGVGNGSKGGFIDFFAGGNAGLCIDLMNMSDRYGSDGVRVNHHPFFEGTTGVMLPLGVGGGLKSTGLNFDARVGMWIDPIIAFRVSAIGQEYYYNKRYASEGGDQIGWAGTLVGKGRFEMVMNPLNLTPNSRKNIYSRKFDLNVAVGLDMGVIRKNSYLAVDAHKRSMMIGFTVAPQFIYNATPSTGIFIEPRYEHAISWAESGKEFYGNHANDNLVTINAGVRVSRPTAQQMKHHKPLGFQPYFFLGANLGGYRTVVESKENDGGRVGAEITFNVGYHLTPLHSVKIMYEPSLYFVRHSKTAHKMHDIRAMYMLNFSNLYQHEADRRVDIYMQVGPSISTKRDNGDRKVMSGGAFGFQVLYHISKRFSLTAEPLGQFYFKKGFVPECQHRPMGTMRLDMNAGVMYNF